VVEYEYDGGGRLTRKVIRDNPVDDDTVRFDASYEFDGRGQLVKERILQYDSTDTSATLAVKSDRIVASRRTRGILTTVSMSPMNAARTSSATVVKISSN